jgi:nucleotide-binding universal stress UspA family protein
MKALVPLDGSENSHRIFLTVRRLLAMQPAIEVHLVTVHDPHATRGRTDHAVSEAPAQVIGRMSVSAPMPRLVESHGEAMERRSIESRAELSDLARNEIPAASFVTHVAWSEHTAEAINELAEQIDADVIVMATHGRSGLSHLLAGSVTEGVIRQARRPVLVQGPGAQ